MIFDKPIHAAILCFEDKTKGSTKLVPFTYTLINEALLLIKKKKKKNPFRYTHNLILSEPRE